MGEAKRRSELGLMMPDDEQRKQNAERARKARGGMRADRAAQSMAGLVVASLIGAARPFPMHGREDG